MRHHQQCPLLPGASGESCDRGRHRGSRHSPCNAWPPGGSAGSIVRRRPAQAARGLRSSTRDSGHKAMRGGVSSGVRSHFGSALREPSWATNHRAKLRQRNPANPSRKNARISGFRVLRHRGRQALYRQQEVTAPTGPLSIGVLATSLKPNERRLPIHPQHLERIAPEVRRQLRFEYGYGERFGVPDSKLESLVGGSVHARS